VQGTELNPLSGRNSLPLQNSVSSLSVEDEQITFADLKSALVAKIKEDLESLLSECKDYRP
jgi:hypothetical protein